MNNTDAKLLPENAGCPQCGSTTAKRWRSYSGVELCTDCEWDYFANLNTRKLLDAQQARQPSTPRAPRRQAGSAILPQCANPHNGDKRAPLARRSGALGIKGSTSRPPDDVRCKVKWVETMEKIITPGYNSLCLLCSRIFYGAKLERCTRCGGLTQQVSDHDLGLMGRHGQRLVEQER